MPPDQGAPGALVNQVLPAPQAQQNIPVAPAPQVQNLAAQNIPAAAAPQLQVQAQAQAPAQNPQQANPLPVMAAPRSKADMPPRGSRHAPKTFKGSPTYAKEFLVEYEALCADNNVTANDEKCSLLKRYCNSKVREILETIYEANMTWATFKAKFEKLFDSDKNERRYNKKDLKAFLRKSRHKSLNSMTKVLKYYRNFQKIAGWLKLKNKITNAEYDKSFWQESLDTCVQG